MDASLWTDAEVVVGPDGMARVIPLPRAADQPAGMQRLWESGSEKAGEFIPLPYLSVAVANIGAAAQPVALPLDAMAIAPTPPGVPSSNCEQCGKEVAGDYSSHRAHVFVSHNFQRETTELATQEALKAAIGECFPESVVRNDLMVGG